MATGSAKVVDSSGSSSVSDSVRTAAETAVRDAQNSGATKKEVIQARDAAKAGVYNDVVKAINSGGSYNGMNAQQLQNELFGGLQSTDFSNGTPVEFVQSRDHLLNMRNAGFYDANWNPTSKASQMPPPKAHSQIKVIGFEPAAIQPEDLNNMGIRQRIRYELQYRGHIKKATENTPLAFFKDQIPNYYDPAVLKKTEENAVDLNSLLKYNPATSTQVSESNPFKIDVNNIVDSGLAGVAFGLTGEDWSGNREKIQAAGNSKTNYIDQKVAGLHEWSVNKLDKNLGPLGAAIRGATTDVVGGVGALVSEGYKTGVAGFREGKIGFDSGSGITRTQAFSDRFASMLGFGVGTMVGGTASAAIHDPFATVGGFIGTGGLAGGLKIAGKAGGLKVKMFTQTRGKTEIPITNLAESKLVNMGGDVLRKTDNPFPSVYPTKKGITIKEGIGLLKDAKNLYPGQTTPGKQMGIHIDPKNRGAGGKIWEAAPGTSPEKGVFVADTASLRFTHIPHLEFGKVKLSGFSNPLSDVKSVFRRSELSPRIMFIEGSGYRRMPKSALATDKTAAAYQLSGKGNKNYFHVTQKMEYRLPKGKNTEIEAVVLPGTKLKRVESKYRTTVKQPIDIFGRKHDINISIPVEKHVIVPDVRSTAAKTGGLSAGAGKKSGQTITLTTRPRRGSAVSGSLYSGKPAAAPKDLYVVDLTYSSLGLAKPVKSKNKGYSYGAPASKSGDYKYPVVKMPAAGYSYPGYSGSSTKATVSVKSAPAKVPVKTQTQKKRKNEPEFSPVKRQKKTTKTKTAKEYRINPLKGLRI